MKNLEYDLMEFIKFLGDTDKYKQRLEDIERSKESVTTEKNLASAERQQAMEAQADLDKKIKYYESLKQEVEAKQSSASRLLKAVEEKGSALKSKEKELDEKESNLDATLKILNQYEEDLKVKDTELTNLESKLKNKETVLAEKERYINSFKANL